MMIRRRTTNKYGAVSSGGFHSKLEHSVFQLLKLLEKAGEIEVLQTQDHIYLTAARIGYVPDFKCKNVQTGAVYWVEAKGFEAPRWPVIKKLWSFYGPGELHIYKGSYQKPYLDEVIIPKGEK